MALWAGSYRPIRQLTANCRCVLPKNCPSTTVAAVSNLRYASLFTLPHRHCICQLASVQQAETEQNVTPSAGWNQPDKGSADVPAWRPVGVSHPPLHSQPSQPSYSTKKGLVLRHDVCNRGRFACTCGRITMHLYHCCDQRSRAYTSQTSVTK